MTTAVLVIGLSFILAYIQNILPNKNIWIGGFDTKSSCDLVSNSGSAIENAFNIDLRSPLRLSFGAAKGIDVVWDLVVGQGGRLLLAWVSYKVFMDGLARLLETSAVSYNLYTLITFNTSSLMSTWQSTKEIFETRGWRGKCFLAWFSISTIYVLGFSTLLSAATGYVSPSTIGFRMQDQNFLAQDSDALTSCFTIAKGSLIGLPDMKIIRGPPIHVFDPTSRQGHLSDSSLVAERLNVSTKLTRDYYT